MNIRDSNPNLLFFLSVTDYSYIYLRHRRIFFLSTFWGMCVELEDLHGLGCDYFPAWHLSCILCSQAGGSQREERGYSSLAINWEPGTALATWQALDNVCRMIKWNVWWFHFLTSQLIKKTEDLWEKVCSHETPNDYACMALSSQPWFSLLAWRAIAREYV